ncbi:MAG: NADH-quinone oxidoreductase subunit C [Candidatus Bipolaricaulota bacterium]|nr:NADH-quinone oxidoreductase subunit C [Candidatus Bipolaricaulota bacterium]
MSEAETVVQELVARFPALEGHVTVQRDRVWVDVDRKTFAPVFEHLAKHLGFSNLLMITGLDVGTDLEFIYHLARSRGGIANVKVHCPKGESQHTITGIFPGGGIYERELVDLLGAKIDGLPEGSRYPLPDNWPKDEHPLLKDWKPREKGAQDA